MVDDPTVIIKEAFPDYAFVAGDIMAVEGQNYEYNANGVFTITESDAEPIDDILKTDTVKDSFPGKQFSSGDTVTLGGIAYTLTAAGSFIKSAASLLGGIAGTGAGGNKIETPPKWDEVQDARKLPGAGKYPNYWAHKTRSGHVLMLDDSKGAESVTIQHRGGSMIQIMPDGKVHVRAQNGQHTVVFGENRMYVTGAQDITIDGAASLVCKKDYNITAKNLNLTTEQDFNIVARNFNVNASKKVDIQGESMTAKMKKNLGLLAQGAMGMFSKGGYSAGSTGDSAIFVGQKDVGIGANEGRLMTKSAGKMSFLSKSAMSMRADGGKMSVSASGDVAIDADGNIKIQSGDSEPPEDAKTIVVAKPE